MNPMHILYSHYLPNVDQPAGHMIRAIARELRGLGHDVSIHASAGQPLRPIANLATAKPKRFQRLRARLWFAKAIARDVMQRRRDRATLERIAPDVLLVRQDSYCSSMTWAGHRLGIPVVTYADAPVACEARQRNNNSRWHPRGLVETIEKWGLSRSAAVVTVSEPAAKTLREYGLTTPIHAISNGIDPANYPRLTSAERMSERRRLGLNAQQIVGFQGTFQAFHGIDRLRELMMSTATRSDTQWLLIGDGPECTRLEQAVRGKVNAVFVGRQPNERMGGLLGLLDIGVAPYSSVPGAFYGCPLKVLEYAAAGCAVVASGQGDVPALLDHGRAGIVVNDDDSGTWIRELNQLLDDPTRCHAIGKYAHEWIHERYTWRNTAERLEEILNDALDRTGGPLGEPSIPNSISEVLR